jgi:hypothetical protein
LISLLCGLPVILWISVPVAIDGAGMQERGFQPLNLSFGP